MKYLYLFISFVFTNYAYAQSPPACEHWPKTMALMGMRNAGIVDLDKINEDKTKFVLLAYQALPNGLFKEIYDITYFSNEGKLVFEVITSSESSYEECSMSDVTTFLISRHIE
ncbi:hypothetical protein [Acetobacter sp. DsW_54]|uniref:hypothetical protein n=1 Tax=Acetobacter sp. DsW_54 TaxID=1670660 RepID=UPI0018E91A4B|nr:hypothetical protein [Acetobacter sp. DsW_54]